MAYRYLSPRAFKKFKARQRMKESIGKEVSLTNWQNHQWLKARDAVLEHNKQKGVKKKPIPQMADFVDLQKPNRKAA